MMERLTYFDHGKYRLKIGDTEHSGLFVDRLAAYEDTGLEPEEIKSLQAEWSVNLKVLDEYRKLGSVSCIKAAEPCMNKKLKEIWFYAHKESEPMLVMMKDNKVDADVLSKEYRND